MSDEDVIAFAQSIELAAVAMYDGIVPKLSSITMPMAQQFQHHHADHAQSLGPLAADKAVTAPNAGLVFSLQPSLQAVTDDTSALTLAYRVENQIAETYAYALTLLTTPAMYQQAATILPIESAHAAVLGAALGIATTGVFVNGGFEGTQVGDGSDASKGFDPAVFPR